MPPDGRSRRSRQECHGAHAVALLCHYWNRCGDPGNPGFASFLIGVRTPRGPINAKCETVHNLPPSPYRTEPRYAHRSISPNTMSSEPRIAETSASMWPRVKKSMACRCAKEGARILHLYGLLLPSDTR